MEDLKKFLKCGKLERVKTDNNVFKLHYKFTVILLTIFCVLLSSKQFFGDPINCDVDEGKKDIIDIFCWISGTFIIDKNVEDLYLAGLGNDPSDKPEGKTKMLYYQWVFVIFCVQAVCFYCPRYLWKSWEAGLLSHLVKDLGSPIVTDKWTSSLREKLIKYITSRKHFHNIYVLRYAFCEALNLLNVILQVFFANWYLGGKFSSYGISVSKQMVKTMNYVFPKITKCKYFRYGPTGSIESRDALCVLTLNILNEKFFIILWYWFFTLMFLTSCAVIYRVLFLSWSTFRMHLLRAQTRNLNIDRKKIQVIVDEVSFGDFYVLYRMGQNLNPVLYTEILMGIFEELEIKKPMKNVFDV